MTPFDAAIAEVALTQHGAVALAQMIEIGFTASGVRDRAARGALHRVHRGVYAVGHASLTQKGRWMAAVLAFARAALSHASAAALRGLRPTSAADVDVVVPRRTRSRSGIRVHSGASLLARDIDHVDGIPCTSAARTLLDLAPMVDRRGLERACDRAHNLGTFDLRSIEDVLARALGHRGVPLLRAVLDDHEIGTTETHSPLEERFLPIIDSAGFPRPVADYALDVDGEPVTVDFAWPAERVLVELDSWAYHGNPITQARDIRRTRRLALMGWTLLRFTDSDLDDPHAVERDVRIARAGV